MRMYSQVLSAPAPVNTWDVVSHGISAVLHIQKIIYTALDQLQLSP